MQGREIEIEGHTVKVVDCQKISYWQKLPFCMRILLENGLRNEPDQAEKWIAAFEGWLEGKRSDINFYPSRVLMQDLTGVPAIVDLALMREVGGDINPKCQVDLVIDHSVIVDYAKDENAFANNVAMEVKRNKERYAFLKWAQQAFTNLRIVPPGKGICHQVNLEYLADVIACKNDWCYPDTLVGLDSHTTMINGLGVLAWGVGGIEAEAAMLGQPISLQLPDVVGVELKGKVKAGVSATDLVLHLTEIFRQKGVVGKFLEFVGEGTKQLTLAERATIANMAPEYGATCAFFPVDQVTLDYLELTARDPEIIARVKQYTQHMQMFWQDEMPSYTEKLVIDLEEVESCIAGPKTPDQRLPLSKVKSSVKEFEAQANRKQLSDLSVVIAAITSCTNTSNPSVLIAAGLLARKAIEKGLKVPSWVKPSFAPGSRVVMDYMSKLGLDKDLERLGFYLVGYGCTTCIGNSGPLLEGVESEVEEKDLTVCSVLSGNRNFEGRVHPQTKLNYLASPQLVVAYALAGSMLIDFEKEPIDKEVYLRDIWPTEDEIASAMASIQKSSFEKEYATIFEGEADWQEISVNEGLEYQWDDQSTYIRKAPFFDKRLLTAKEDLEDARILAIFGDNVTTDHISPAGSIAKDSPAANYLRSKGVSDQMLHSYGARRGNAEVMMRGTFANIRLNNLMADGKAGGFTKVEGKLTTIFDAALHYQDKHPLVVFAKKQYGMGSSRDWAAKGTLLLGIKAVIAESFERIHRSNLIGMGVLPCLIEDLERLDLRGDEKISIEGITDLDSPNQQLTLYVNDQAFKIKAAINTQNELRYYRQGGILPSVLSQMN